MKKQRKNLALATAGIVSVLAASQFLAAPSAKADLVVYQVGTGTGALTSASTAVLIDDFSVGGTLQGQIVMPTVASGLQDAMTASGSATSEGQLTVSPNGQWIAVTGYDAPVATSGIAGTSSATIPRVVGIINTTTGAVDTSTALNVFSANNPRSAVTTDGSQIWFAGAGSASTTTPATGIGSTTIGSTGTSYNTINNGNQRQINIFNGQLYTSSGSASGAAIGIGIASVGSGLPTSGIQTGTLFPGVDTGSSGNPYAYFMDVLNGADTFPDTIYVADNTTAQAIEKYTFISGAWTLTGQVSQSGVTGLAAIDNGGVVSLYLTTGSKIVELTDSSGYDGVLSGTPTTIATAATNTAFRGIGIGSIPVPEPASISLIGVGGLSLLARRRKRKA